ncbi:hypothetical protein QJQ45_013718, partial [Haematococcus lacustris]
EMSMRTHRRCSVSAKAAPSTTRQASPQVTTRGSGPTTRGGSPARTTGKGTLTKSGSQLANKERPEKRPSQFYAFITGFPFPLGPAFQRKTVRYEPQPKASASAHKLNPFLGLDLLEPGLAPAADQGQHSLNLSFWIRHVGFTTATLSSDQQNSFNFLFFNFLFFNFLSFNFLFFQLQRRQLTVERGTIWTFEQTQALELFDVYTPVRMTVIKLKSGGLWVHAPVAPTEECVRLVKELGAPVEYIVLPTFAYEHKAFVYVSPYQWSFPLNLPPQFFGIFPAGELKSDDPDTPWADEIEQKVFLPPSIGVGDFVRFCEVAFFHKRSRTLLVTDAVLYVDQQPPDIIPVPSLLELARDNLLARFVAGGRTAQEVKEIARPEPVEDTPANRRRGWMRMALLVLYFSPSDLLDPEESFRAISNRLFVGPVVELLVYNKVLPYVRAWVDDIVSSWNFRQIIPCHFAAPVKADPLDFKRAFTFAYQGQQDQEEDERSNAATTPTGPLSFLTSLFGPKFSSTKLTRPVVFPEADVRALNALNDGLLRFKLVKPNADK